MTGVRSLPAILWLQSVLLGAVAVSALAQPQIAGKVPGSALRAQMPRPASAAAVTPALAAAPTPAVPATDMLFASPTRLDHIGRIVAPVMVDGKGPFRFIVDTGASRSTISPRLAQTLGLNPSSDAPLVVNGITGTAEVPSVSVHRLQAGDLVLEDTRMPVVWAPLMAGSDGILGVAGLVQTCIQVDFRHDRVVIRRSSGPSAFPGYDVVPARILDDGLMVVKARVGGVRVDAVIDTGSERTLANDALRAALAWRHRKGKVDPVTEVYGATREIATGQIAVAPTIDFGRVKISNVTVVYGDFHIFQVWGMQKQPAIVIGMDILGTVNGLAIDFRRSELYLDSEFHLG